MPASRPALSILEDERFTQLATRAREVLPELAPWGLSNLAWSCAVLQWQDEPLLAAIASSAVPQQAQFIPK